MNARNEHRAGPRSIAMQRRALLAGVVTSMLAGCAETFFFHPDSQTYTPRSRLGTVAEDCFFESDGARLHGWWMPAIGQAVGTVVHLHGNAANVSNHAPQIAWLPAEGFNVLTFDYRGFGFSEGTPSLHGVVKDARAAIAQARRRQPDLPLVVLGQSLGGATAIRAVVEETRDDIRLLVIDSAFASYRGIVHDATRTSLLSLISPFAATTLPAAAQDPSTAIARLRIPVLIVHGESDRVVPISHGEHLYASATAAPHRHLVRIPGGGHLDALSREDVRRRIVASMTDACNGMAGPHRAGPTRL